MKVFSESIKNGVHVHIMSVEDASESHIFDGVSNLLLQSLNRVVGIARLCLNDIIVIGDAKEGVAGEQTLQLQWQIKNYPIRKTCQ